MRPGGGEGGVLGRGELLCSLVKFIFKLPDGMANVDSESLIAVVCVTMVILMDIIMSFLMPMAV